MKSLKSAIVAFFMAVGTMTGMCANATDSIAAPTNDVDSLSRAVATVLAGSVDNAINGLDNLGLSYDRQTIIKHLILALNGGTTGFTGEDANNYMRNVIQNVAKNNRPKVEPLSLEAEQAFVAEQAKTKGAVTTQSGLVFITINNGAGDMPKDGDKVVVEYEGKLSDGTVFDKTEPGNPITFDVNRLIPGFTEGLKMMKKGGTYRLIIPHTLAYGEKGIEGAIPGNATLDFKVTLVDIVSK